MSPHHSDNADPPGRCKIVIPLYQELTNSEMAALLHNVRILKAHAVTIVGPRSLSKYLDNEIGKNILRETGRVPETLSLPDQNFTSIGAYNSLMISRGFYDHFFDVDHILICQTDCLILRDELDDWTRQGYSFVGAPVFRGFAEPDLPYQFTGALNGGLSLRNMTDFRKVMERTYFADDTGILKTLKKLGIFKILNLVLGPVGKRIVPLKPGLHEDVFWTRVIPRHYADFHIAPPLTAARFAFEAAPEYLLEHTGGTLPLGCHAYQKYGETFWREHFPDAVFSDS